MSKSSKSKLTVEHIEYASNNQLAKLIKVHPSATSHWLKRNFNSNSMKICYTCIDLETLIAGFVRRKNNSEKSRKLQKEFEEILANSEKLNESAVA